MKCDELKPLKNIEIAFNTTTQQEQVIAEDSEGNCYGFDSWEEVYLKDQVDAAIAELKAENERLNDELDAANNQCENLINSATDIMLRQDKVNDTKCAEIEKLTTENRRLKRALYKACANWMINRQVTMACYHLEARAKKFDKAIDKCRSMAEEYK